MTEEQDNTKTILLILLAVALIFSIFYISSMKQQYLSSITAILAKQGIIV